MAWEVGKFFPSRSSIFPDRRSFFLSLAFIVSSVMSLLKGLQNDLSALLKSMPSKPIAEDDDFELWGRRFTSLLVKCLVSGFNLLAKSSVRPITTTSLTRAASHVQKTSPIFYLKSG